MTVTCSPLTRGGGVEGGGGLPVLLHQTLHVQGDGVSGHEHGRRGTQGEELSVLGRTTVRTHPVTTAHLQPFAQSAHNLAVRLRLQEI